VDAELSECHEWLKSCIWEW